MCDIIPAVSIGVGARGERETYPKDLKLFIF